MPDVTGYLRRLGFPRVPDPTVETLYALHAAHVERVAYEVLDIHLDRFVPIDPASSVARIASGRGGYCYTLNGGLSVVLRTLGYQVRWHRAGVQNLAEETAPGPARANHLALTVHGLPSPECPDGDWLVDAGLGDGLHEPLPLRSGTYWQGPFRYQLRPSELVAGGWRLDHDPSGSFTGMDFEPRAADVPDFQARHEYLSTSPESGFVRTCVVQRRDGSGTDSLRGCVLRRVGSGLGSVSGLGFTERVLDTPGDWFGALADVFGLPLTDLNAADRDRLWRRVITAHQYWLSTRP